MGMGPPGVEKHSSEQQQRAERRPEQHPEQHPEQLEQRVDEVAQRILELSDDTITALAQWIQVVMHWRNVDRQSLPLAILTALVVGYCVAFDDDPSLFRK